MAMTAKEAIKRINDHIAVHHIGEPPHIHIGEALQIAIEATEKQIPKKQRTDNHDWRCCPRCYKTFSMVNVLNERNRYCGNCGQALDWSG